MERVLPSNTRAEEAVLGSILLNREAIVAVANDLRPDAFYDERNAWIYEAMLDCYRRRVTPTLLTVAEVLRAKQRLELIGGVAALGALTDRVESSYYINDYAAAVAGTAARRQMISAAQQIAQLGYAEEVPLDEALAKMQATVTPLVSMRRGDRGLVRITDVMSDLTDYIYSDDNPAVPSGFIDYDEKYGGYFRGELYLIGGRPGHGKSSYAGDVACNVASNGGYVGVFSQEMAALHLAIRYLSRKSGMDGRKIRRKQLDDNDRQGLVDHMGAMDWNLFIDDRLRSISEIAMLAQKFVAEHGRIDLLIVDYLQLVKAANARAERREQVADIARDLLAIGKELNCPVLAPTQMNRDIEGRNDKTPMLSDLGDSGELERAAHRVDFIIQPAKWDESVPETTALLYTEKDRNGEVGVTPLIWDGATTSFRSAAPSYRTPEGY